MNAPNTQPELTEKSAELPIEIWENEGGALRHEALVLHYGRRVEADRSWTVYHVFTGVPAARIDSSTMIGLTQGVATDGMLSLNRRNEARRCDTDSPSAGIRTVPCGAEERRR